MRFYSVTHSRVVEFDGGGTLQLVEQAVFPAHSRRGAIDKARKLWAVLPYDVVSAKEIIRPPSLPLIGPGYERPYEPIEPALPGAA